MLAGKKEWLLYFIGYAALIISLLANGYLIADSTFLIGTGLLAFIICMLPARGKSLRLLLVVMLFFIGSFFIQELTFRYLTLLFAILFTIESLYSKTSPLIFWILIIISPLFKYLSEVFTFPIRLQLSEWAGKLLQIANFPVTVTGNVIQVNGTDFRVDPACMGLQMTGFSLLAGIFLLVHYQRSSRKELPLLMNTLLMILVFGLNILSNLMRIIMLVIFKIAPENPIHDIVGVLCLLLYVWIPVSLLARYLFKRYGRLVSERPIVVFRWKSMISVLNCMILLGCGYLIFQEKKINISSAKNPIISPAGEYNSSVLRNGIIRFRNDSALIYVKPIPAFYSTDHSPVTCWKGSGYEFTNIREENFAGRRIYFGTLKKGTDILHTAWWFSNNHHTTISQIDWRWKVIRGEPGFQLVNVTAGDQKDLKQAIIEWMPRI
ncbi:MAG: exosortase N [Dyadobacter sp.]|uniref:exosortase N n=1 Tax=Dyadobacter sp. TaxID=1914288 RepID=UPI003262FB2C